jgi:hypothetical protein
MLLGCGGNDTSSLIDDESARTSSAYVDPKKIHCRFARFLCAYTIGQVRWMFRIRIVNFKIVYCLRARHDTPKPTQQSMRGAPSQKRGFAQIVGQREEEEELCFQTRLTAGMQFSRLCLC